MQREFVITGNSSVNGFSGWHWITQWTALWSCLCYSFPIRFGLDFFLLPKPVFPFHKRCCMSTFSLNTHVAAVLFNKTPVQEKQRNKKGKRKIRGVSEYPSVLWRCSNRCSHHSSILLVVMSVAPSCTLSQLHCKPVFTQFNACSVRQIIPLSQKHSTFPRSTSTANREGTYPFMAYSFDFKGEKDFSLRKIFISIASRLKSQIPG